MTPQPTADQKVHELQAEFNRKFRFLAASNLREVALAAVMALENSHRSAVALPPRFSKFNNKQQITGELLSYHRNGGSQDEAARVFWNLMLLMCEDTVRPSGMNYFERRIIAYLNGVCTQMLDIFRAQGNYSGTRRTADDRREVAEEAGELAGDAAGNLAARFFRWLFRRDGSSSSGGSSGSGGGGGGSWLDNLDFWLLHPQRRNKQ